jgi:hypothetical protein
MSPNARRNGCCFAVRAVPSSDLVIINDKKIPPTNLIRHFFGGTNAVDVAGAYFFLSTAAFVGGAQVQTTPIRLEKDRGKFGECRN